MNTDLTNLNEEIPLNEKGVPRIDYFEELCASIMIFEMDLNNILLEKERQEKNDNHFPIYRIFRIPKRDGQYRIIESPVFELKRIQRWICWNILLKFRPTKSCYGFMKGKSICDNAKQHVGKPAILRLDIKDFFPSINKDMVRQVFLNFQYPDHIAELFAEITTFKGHIPQGAPTSPAISNIVSYLFDRRIEGYLNVLNKNSKYRDKVVYTRYADDLTFSGEKKILRRIQTTIIEILNEEGFKVNQKKTSLKGRGACQMVTGVVVNDTPNVPRNYRKRIRAILYDCKVNGVERANREKRWNFKEYLRGHVDYIKMINPELGKKFLKEFNAIFNV